jgi:hypothetical protein
MWAGLKRLTRRLLVRGGGHRKCCEGYICSELPPRPAIGRGSLTRAFVRELAAVWTSSNATAPVRRHALTRSFDFFARLLFVSLLCVACSDLPCTESGSAFMTIPELLVPSVTSISSDGEAGCEAAVPTGNCVGTECTKAPDGSKARLVAVKAMRTGQCTVTVTFSNGCAPHVAVFQFGGAKDNCCSDVCVRSGEGHVVPSSCN